MAALKPPGPLRALRLGLPLGASLALHGLLIILAALVVWDVAWFTGPSRPEVQISFDDPGRGGPRGTTEAAPPPSPHPPAAPAPAPSPGAVAIVPDSTPAAPPVLTGLASAGPSQAQPARLEPIAAPPAAAGAVQGITPAGAEVKFAGLGASSARSVVFVIDGSGPMVSSLSVVLSEVERSVGRLSPSQRFGVVVFRKKQTPKPVEPGPAAPGAPSPSSTIGPIPAEAPDDVPGYEWFNPALVRATPEAKQRIGQWLTSVKPGGRSTPLDGLRAAIGMKPDAIFLLSRGIERSGGGVWDLGLKKTMEELDRLNPVDPRTGRRAIVIKTIQFIDEDPTGIMQAIGKAHGGAGGSGGGAGNGGAGGAASAYTVIRREQDLAARQ